MLPGSQNNSRGISIHFTHWNIYGHYFCSKRKIPCHDKQWVLEVFDIKVNSIRIIHSPRTESNMWRGNQKVGQSDGNLIILFPFRYAGKTKEKLGYCFSVLHTYAICFRLEWFQIPKLKMHITMLVALVTRDWSGHLDKRVTIYAAPISWRSWFSCISRISCSNQIDGLAGSFKLI